jgi:hypothetical protein
MAQSGFTPIQLYRSATPGAVPLAADLAPGELALNTADEKLFFENASGVVVSIDKANGTVTSVNASGGFTGLTFSGGPITSSGTLTLSGTLAAVNGGTGQSSYAVGDILFASTTTALSKLADVATGNALISGGVGVAPSYGKIGLTTHVSGTLPVANGGTGTATAFTSGSVVFAGASGVYTQDNANLFWDNTNDRLGSGTTSPAQKLDVNGTVRATAPSAFSAALTVRSDASASNWASLNFENQNVADLGLIYLDNVGTFNIRNAVAGQPIRFLSEANERMRITSAGNVGIGTSSPAQTLQILNAGNYQLRMGGGGSINYDLGRNASNGLFYLYGNQTGFTGYVFDGVDGERMRITSAGNVGVGTSSPAGLLHVNSTSTTNAIVSGSDAARLVINGDTANSGDTGTEDASLIFETDGAYSSAVNSGLGNSGFRLGLLNGSSASTFVFVDILSGVNRERMRIDSSGNVGIGTATPASVLDVNGDVTITDKIIHSGDTNTSIRFPAADTFTVETAGSERMRIDSSGNVGIGTTSPGARLEITDGSNTPLIVNSGGGADTTRGIAFNISGANFGRILVPAASGGAMAFWAGTSGAAAERMRITSAGNVGINETAPDYKLDVNGTFGFTPGASVTPVDNGDVVFELTNNTTLTVKAKGSDGVVRSGTIILV